MTEVWAKALDEYGTHLRAGGAPTTTVGLRMYHLRRVGCWLDIPPFAVTDGDLLRFMAAHDWARETRRSWRSSLRSFYGWAAANGHIARSPADGLPAVRPSVPNPRPVPHEQYELALMTACPRDRLMMRLAAEAGLRRGEVARVHTSDVVEDLTGWSLSVRGKGDKLRLVPLNDSLARTLRAAEPGWVFPGAIDGHISPAWVGKVVSRLLPTGYSMHKLRHLFASDAYAIDRDLLTVQDLLGHASPVTTRAYVRPPDHAKRALVDGLMAARGRPDARRGDSLVRTTTRE